MGNLSKHFGILGLYLVSQFSPVQAQCQALPQKVKTLAQNIIQNYDEKEQDVYWKKFINIDEYSYAHVRFTDLNQNNKADSLDVILLEVHTAISPSFLEKLNGRIVIPYSSIEIFHDAHLNGFIWQHDSGDFYSIDEVKQDKEITHPQRHNVFETYQDKEKAHLINLRYFDYLRKLLKH